MKKFLNNMVLTAALVVTVVFALTGCEVSTDNYGNIKNDGFYYISDTMAYDENTHVIYYKFVTGTFGYMAPYYNEYGQLCRYVDGQIVPIE